MVGYLQKEQKLRDIMEVWKNVEEWKVKNVEETRKEIKYVVNDKLEENERNK